MKWAAFLALALAALCSPAAAATLYISEFANGVGTVNSSVVQAFPQPAITDQTVAITGASVQSSAFNSNTHAIMVECDADCSVAVGTDPTATTANFLMGDGTPYQFTVVPGQKIAVISNTSGGSGSDVNLVSVGGTALALGQATMAASLPVAIASNQSAIPTSNSTQLPAALGQTTMSASLPVTIASNQSAIPVSTSDPCTSAAKSSAAISVATATTTSLVAVSGSTTVYVCGFAMTIAPSAVTAGTALFEYGTGATCTSPTSLTGTFGNGDLTSTVGVAPVIYGGGSQTVFKSASSAGICILTAGNAVSVQGVLTYVQQ